MKNTNLSRLIKKYNNIFLKMDIEGGEYPWLLGLNEDQLNRFKQIVIELHGITHKEYYRGSSYEDKIKVLSKLASTHYLIHAHGNNCCRTIDGIPDVIELTYINKKNLIITPELNTQSLPIENLDFPNKKNKKQINLNFYPFKNVKIDKLVSEI